MQPHLTFSRGQRRGLVVLALLVVVFQAVLCFADFGREQMPSIAERQWLATQRIIDSMKERKKAQRPTQYPFNPNFITDYKGYRLGMSAEELDRLHTFRKSGQYVNSAADFQKVTGVSDSLLSTMKAYFRFPEWVTRKQRTFPMIKNGLPPVRQEQLIDLNEASQEELMKVYGIGPALSERILKVKEKFGAFVSIEQLELVWGLKPEVIGKVKKKFVIGAHPAVRKTRINEASFKEIMQVPYFDYKLTKEVVVYRSMHSGFKSAEDLANVEGFPLEKLKIISLYLEF